MLTRTEWMQLDTALDAMSGVNLNDQMHIARQNVKAIIATFVEGAVKVGNTIKFTEPAEEKPQ